VVESIEDVKAGKPCTECGSHSFSVRSLEFTLQTVRYAPMSEDKLDWENDEEFEDEWWVLTISCADCGHILIDRTDEARNAMYPVFGAASS
jgi:hypothetical protein